jgi:hypothetical protein
MLGWKCYYSQKTGIISPDFIVGHFTRTVLMKSFRQLPCRTYQNVFYSYEIILKIRSPQNGSPTSLLKPRNHDKLQCKKIYITCGIKLTRQKLISRGITFCRTIGRYFDRKMLTLSSITRNSHDELPLLSASFQIYYYESALHECHFAK